MAWVRFTKEHCWTPPEDRRVSMLFKPGYEPVNVRKACADEAISLGRAVRTTAPKRKTGDE